MEGGHVLGVRRLVVGPVDGLDVPAVGLVARADVLGERDVGVVLDRDPVGVVDHREVAELLDAGDGRGLARRRPPRCRRRCTARRCGGRTGDAPSAALGSSSPRSRRAAIAMPDRVADALAERAGRRLDAGGVAELGVAGGLAAPGAQRLDVVELAGPSRRGTAAGRASATSGRRRGRSGPGRASSGRPGCAASPSGRAGTPPAPGSSRCRGGRPRSSARRPWRAPGRCPRPCRRARSSPGSRHCGKLRSQSVLPVPSGAF